LIEFVNAPFYIFQVGPGEAKEIASAPDEPHIHDYEELLIGIEGEIEHFIDFRSDKLPAPFISFVTKGKLHRLVPTIYEGKFDVWAIRFRSEFIPETTFHLYAHYHDHANLALNPGMCFRRIVTLCELMEEETKQSVPDYAVLRHLLNALFIMIEAERKKAGQEDAGARSNQNTTFRNFLQILEENFRRPEGVEFYAEKLFMTARNLNLICQNILQKSVSEIIETRKLTEAKNLLIHTNKTISEIGYELGYNEKSYFTNVFKKKTGQTPGEFREEMKRLLS
jgi:AraC family transcriptional regulator, transcriptional activator of pobA